MNQAKLINKQDLATQRTDYNRHELLEENCSKNPITQFEHWLAEAMEGDSHANALTLCTTGRDGMPDARTVLLRDLSYGGFTFFTNYKSNKAMQMAENPHACLLFFWKDLERQVKVRGTIERLPQDESHLYFDTRPFASKVGSWASDQSATIGNRAELDQRYQEACERFNDGQVPKPPHWGGYVLVPGSFEFWQGRQSRLHDRINYTKKADHTWQITRLMP